MHEYWKKVLEYTKPQYNELTTFLTALICVILFFVHPDFRTTYIDILTGANSGRASFAFILLGIFATFGFLLSIFHVLTNQDKSSPEKFLMGVFVMSANGLAGIVSGTEMLYSRTTTLYFFPLCNIVAGLFLIYQMGLQRFDVSNENASPIEVICGSILLVLIYLLLSKVLFLSWASTFSICMFYISIVFFLYSWIKHLFLRKK